MNAYSYTAADVTPTADARVNTALPLFIMADELIYSDDSSEITGKGNVIARSDDMTIFSDSIYVNTNTGDALAEGNVLAMQKGSSVYTDKLNYNFKKSDSFAEHVDIISPPWICRGEKMTKTGKKTMISEPVFTTCDKHTPHFRLQSSSLTIYEDEKIESWHTVIYLGAIPVFYFPYYSQPLKGERKPFDVKFGHNDPQGWYLRTLYNLDFNQFNKWSLGYDYMEKIGAAYKLNIAYGFDMNSTGSFSGLLSDEFKSTRKRRWSASYSHDHVFDTRTRLNIRTSSASDSDMAKDLLDTQGVDMFRHDYSASFSTMIGDNHTIGVSVADTEILNTITASAEIEPFYYTASRSLPSLTYNMISTQILPRLYYNHGFSFNRIYNLHGGGFYSDTASFTPGMTYSIPSFYILGLSASTGLTSSWVNSNEREKNFLAGDLLNSFRMSETANLEILPYGLLRSTLTHNYQKRLNKLSGLAHDGITMNILNFSLSGGTGIINYNASASYDLLTVTAKPGFDTDRMSQISFSANTSGSDIYFSSNGVYSPYANMIKSISFAFNLRDTGAANLWSLSMMTSFVNNILDISGRRAEIRTPDTMTFNTTLNFNFTPEFSFAVNRQYDLTIKQLTSESYSATWHLHCWESSISYTKRPDRVEEFYFTIFISAIPEARFNKPTTASPDYKLDDLMNR